MIKKIISFICILIVFASCGESATKYPMPETTKNDKILETSKIEFEIAKCDESKVEILKPKSWHFHKTANLVGQAYYITPYVFEDLGEFKRGFSLIIANNVTRETSFAPSQKMEQFIENAKTIDENLKVKRSDMPNMISASFLIKDPSGTPDSLISSIFLIANDKEDILYTFVFQYEKREWNELQPICKEMLKNIKITNVGL